MSDNDEDSMPIAASLTKATKEKKPAKGFFGVVLSFPPSVLCVSLSFPTHSKEAALVLRACVG
jgi:hypothetical protein